MPFMVRQGSPERSRRAHHERNQHLTVRPVEGRLLNSNHSKFRVLRGYHFGLCEIVKILAHLDSTFA